MLPQSRKRGKTTIDIRMKNKTNQIEGQKGHFEGYKGQRRAKKNVPDEKAKTVESGRRNRQRCHPQITKPINEALQV